MGLQALADGKGVKQVSRKAAEESPDRALKKVPEGVLTELCDLKDAAKGAAEDFAVAIELQAEKHGMPKSALARYVAARVSDKVTKLAAEVEATQLLLGLE
jgi:hypothetical protein